MGHSPSFTVVIPLYNKARHIRRAITSAMAQTYRPVEIIVVDDGSKDGGLDIAAEYEVRIIKRGMPGSGGYAARNVGVQAATTEWIAFLDADDEWNNDHLEIHARAISNSDGVIALAASGYQLKYSETDRRQDIYARLIRTNKERSYSYTEFLKLWTFLKDCPVWTSATTARRDFCQQVGLFPAERCRRGGDKDLWLRLASVGNVIMIPDNTATYHKDSDNMVTNIKHVNECHCIAKTIDGLLISADRRQSTYLRRIINLETIKYALRNHRENKIDRKILKDFHVSVNIGHWALLNALTTRPGLAIARFLSKRGLKWQR